MELIGSLSRDIRSLCVVINWPPKKQSKSVNGFEYR